MCRSLSSCDRKRVPDAVAPAVREHERVAVAERPRRGEDLQRPAAERDPVLGPARGDGGELQAGARRVPRSSSTVSRSRCNGRGDAQLHAATAARGPENHSRRHGENRDLLLTKMRGHEAAAARLQRLVRRGVAADRSDRALSRRGKVRRPDWVAVLPASSCEASRSDTHRSPWVKRCAGALRSSGVRGRRSGLPSAEDLPVCVAVAGSAARVRASSRSRSPGWPRTLASAGQGTVG